MANVIALGWYVNFGHVDRMEAIHRHYASVIGLPSYLKWRMADGNPEDKDYFWGGEAVIFDVNYGGKVLQIDARQSDPAKARQTPFFRVHQLDHILAGVRARGGEVTPTVDGPFGREACVHDPMGLIIGLREARSDSPLPCDREAARRHARGEAFNPGCASMPQGWQELGWVRLRAADPERLTAFYVHQLGLPVVAERDGVSLLDIGDNVMLEIAPGGAVRPPQPDQMSSVNALIFRVRRLGELVDSLKQSGVRFVGPPYTNPKGDFLYFADPEGNTMGVSNRKHPSAYCRDVPVAPEDLEAERRRAEADAPAA